jgi:type I restriction enzyme S subunit
LSNDIGAVNCANIVFARPFKGISDYLNIYFQSKFCQETLAGLTTGSAQGVINTKSVAEVPIPIPPEEEQKEIIVRIQALLTGTVSVEQQYQQSIDRLEHLDRSILAKAFRGELVEQDPNDEPASVLLERIRAEREQQTQGKAKKLGEESGR